MRGAARRRELQVLAALDCRLELLLAEVPIEDVHVEQPVLLFSLLLGRLLVQNRLSKVLDLFDARLFLIVVRVPPLVILCGSFWRDK